MCSPTLWDTNSQYYNSGVSKQKFSSSKTTSFKGGILTINKKESKKKK